MMPLIGFGMVLVCAGLMIFFALPRSRRSRVGLRVIPAFTRLGKSIGLAVEEGKRLHVSIGKASVLDASFASALTGLSALARVAQISILSDRPPLATSGEGALALLSQDTLRAAYRTENAMEQYDPDRGRLAGATPFSYIAGAIPIIRNEGVSANLLVGNFGPEVALLCDAAENEKSFTLAASDALEAQAVLYAAAEEPLIGEELFAIPAYLQAGAIYQGSLRAQDVLRWLVVGALVVGALLNLIPRLLGFPLL